MSRYFQCSKCKELKSFNPKTTTLKRNGEKKKIIDPDFVKNKLVCCGRRMREITESQYKAEYDQRNYVSGRRFD